MRKAIEESHAKPIACSVNTFSGSQPKVNVVVIAGCGTASSHLIMEHLTDVSGLPAHVWACDDLEPGLAPHHATVILYKLDAVLYLYTWMPAGEERHQSPVELICTFYARGEIPIIH